MSREDSANKISISKRVLLLDTFFELFSKVFFTKALSVLWVVLLKTSLRPVHKVVLLSVHKVYLDKNPFEVLKVNKNTKNSSKNCFLFQNKSL